MSLKFSILTIILCLISYLANGQHSEHNDNQIHVSTHNFHTKNKESLKFDYYTSEHGTKQTPLIIYIHGGGFMTGSRASAGIKYFADRMVNEGFDVASVSYRLTMKDRGFNCEISAEEKLEAINEASYDVSMAIKHILNYPKTFKIDRKKIILIGSSAGAETALNMAFNYPLEDHFKKFKPAAVVSLAGAIANIKELDENNAVPTQLFHGTGDPTVPYHTASHHYCGSDKSGYLVLHGAYPIANKIKSLGVSSYLFTIVGGTHRWAGKALNTFFPDILDFVKNDVVNQHGPRNTERIVYDNSYE